jgi:hypothetical protein
MVAAWMGRGLVIPSAARQATTSGETPRASKVVMR